MRAEKMPLPTAALENEPSSERIALDSETMVIFDLDRTLINSDSLADITLLNLEDLISASDEKNSRLDRKTAITAIEKVRLLQKEETGNSFAYLEVLQSEMGTTGAGWIKGLADNVINANRDDQGAIKQSFINQIMLPNAIEILDKVDRSDADWMIMTAGKPTTQLYKLALIERILAESHATDISRVSYFVTDPDHQHSKAEMINRSFTEGDEGRKHFDPVVMSKYSTNAAIASHLTHEFYEKIVLVDDKINNLRQGDDTVNDQIVTILARRDNNPEAEGVTLNDIMKFFTE